MLKKVRFNYILNWFEKNFPIAETELKYSNPFQLLVAVILSAQCTDKRVNLVTPLLFQRFPDAKALAESTIDEIFEYIRSVSYPNNKAKHLHGMARMLLKDFEATVPETMEDLLKLPGVGRKTANVILSVIYNQPAMAVDTHVFRVSARLGLSTASKSPFETEKQLMKYIPQHLVPKAHHWLILHGRYICLARKPKCADCGLTEWCKFFQKSGKE